MTNVEGRKPEGAPERSAKAGEGAASGVDGNVAKRFSVPRKMAVVARMLRGEPLELVAREIRFWGGFMGRRRGLTHLAVFRAKISDLRPDVNSPRHCACMCDQGDGSRTDLASVLQEGGQSANMYIRSGAIGEISAKYPFTHEMKTLLAGLILIHSWYPNECCADKDCHPVPCDEISEAENGAMHWKNLIFEGSQIRTSPDSECHVCHLLEEGRPVIPICIFTQKKPSA